MQNSTKELETLYKITEKINAGLTLEEVLEQVYESFDAILPYDRIGIALLEHDPSGKAILKSVWHKTKSDRVEIKPGYSAHLEGSSLESIIETGQPRIINDLRAYLQEHPHSDSTQKIVAEGMQSSLTCPLIVGKPIGVIFFSSMHPHTYQEVHVEIYLEIAGHLSLIIEKSRLYERLADLNQLKNRFLGMAAHDLRSPLAIIKGYLSLLLDNVVGPVSEQQQKILRKMSAVSENMIELIDDLLDVSAIEAGSFELHIQEVSLEGFMHDFYESAKFLAEAKSINIELQLEEGLGHIKMDPNRIYQVVMNLFTNALKYSHPQSKVVVQVKGENNEVVFLITDQGQGIPQKELNHIFKAFHKTSVLPTAGEKSTGLGLAIAHRIVEAHGGRIWVESKEGDGSIFAFSLPR